METTKQRPEWMKDPLVRDIHPKKLDFLEQLFQEAHGKSQKELIAFLMPMLRKAKKEKLTLTSSEMQAAVTAIKKHSTEAELQQIENLLHRKQGT